MADIWWASYNGWLSSQQSGYIASTTMEKYESWRDLYNKKNSNIWEEVILYLFRDRYGEHRVIYKLTNQDTCQWVHVYSVRFISFFILNATFVFFYLYNLK